MVHALLLPSELKHRIAELSSHNSLASLARTHTAYQRQAEQALYRSLSSPSSKCLETLSTNSEKAGFVRSLVMEYFKFLYKNDYQQATSYLLNALVNMHSLSDLRLRMFRSEDQIWIESLNKILWSVYEPGSFDIPETNCRLHSNVHFRLRTLYCDKSLDLFGIIRSQTELQILGIYEYHYDDEVRFLETLKQLQNAQLHLPVVVSLDSDSGYANFGRIGIYPAFNSIDRHPTIHQVLAESFDKGQTSYTLPVADAGDISELSIYLVDSDSCNISSVHVLIKNMAMTFPKITSLTFCFENPCEIPSQEMKKIVSLLPDLDKLNFGLWPPWHNVDGKIPKDIKMNQLRDWELACPKLLSVSFLDGSKLQKRGAWVEP